MSNPAFTSKGELVEPNPEDTITWEVPNEYMFVHGKGIQPLRMARLHRRWWEFWKPRGVWIETEPNSGKYRKWKV
jgi:hypothetical protein